MTISNSKLATAANLDIVRPTEVPAKRKRRRRRRDYCFLARSSILCSISFEKEEEGMNGDDYY
jgi:hypothetical protein